MGTGLAVLVVVDPTPIRNLLSNLLLRASFQVRAIDRQTAETELLSGEMECPDVVVQLLAGNAPNVLDHCSTCHDRCVWVEPAQFDPEQNLLTAATALAKQVCALAPEARAPCRPKPGYRTTHFGIVTSN